MVEGMDGIFRFVNVFGNWLAKVMFLHVLWVGATLLGLVVFGIGPATAALFAVIHKWFEDHYDIPIFKTFFQTYKEQFFKANGLGLILGGIGLFLYFDIRISQNMIQSIYFHTFLLVVLFVYILVVLYFFTIFARYKLGFFQYFKQSLLIALARPLESLAMIICIIGLSYLFSYLPVLLFFAGAGITACPIVWFGYRACVQIEAKLREE